MLLVILILFFSSSIDHIQCDYYSSVSGLEKLLELEQYYLKSLEAHLQQVEALSQQFNSYLDELESGQAKFQNDIPPDLEDPIVAFKSIRRMVVDWKLVQNLTQQIQSFKVFNKSSTISPETLSLPTEDDLNGAARGLARLQHMYRLDSASLAKGYIGDQKFSTAMSAYNCFALGQSLYESQNYLLASEWLIEAWHKVQDIESGLNDDMHQNLHNNASEQEEFDLERDADGIYPYATAVQILEYLGLALHKAGNLKLALAINSELLDIEPENGVGLANKDLFERDLKADRRSRMVTPAATVTEIQHLYEEVCSGRLQQSAREKRHLRCRYATNNVAYYLVGPLKMEELNTDPLVVFYHEAISDTEIEEIMEAAQGSIERSAVGTGNDTSTSDIRISKNDWLHFEDHRFLDKISQRLQDITGLSMESAESLQVANYGIGGHYHTHYDFSVEQEIDYVEDDNRILTAMFYINDVDLGGATAFPILHLAVPPIKGSLVVWYNLHKSLEPDYRMSHAGCPVLKGSKWIANEWFSSMGQEFKRPCHLQADGAISKPYEALGLD